MKFIGSLLTTGVIIGGVWSVALLQLTPANAVPLERKTTLSVKTVSENQAAQITAAPKMKNINGLSIQGSSSHSPIGTVSNLWNRFNADSELHKRLKTYPKKVYVYYRNFSSDYLNADMTIGYSTQVLNQSNNAETIPSGSYETLLHRANYANREIISAWDKIDFRQKLNAVVEIHHLDKSGNSIEIELLVQYL